MTDIRTIEVTLSPPDSGGERVTWFRLLLGSLLMLLLMVLAACSEDTERDGRQQGCQLRLAGVTRADGDPERLVKGNIQLYITNSSTQHASGSFSRANAESEWSNNGLSIDENTQYYMYGFMPAKIDNTDISCTPSAADGDYSKGADLAFTDLPVFSNDDICVVVGVRRVTGTSDVNWSTAAVEGNYGYLSGISSENYLNLLMDHLYARLGLSLCVESKYAQLRQIHLKSVTLKSTYGASISATVSLRSGYGLKDHVSFGQFTSSSEVSTTPYEYQQNDAVTYLPVATEGTEPTALAPVYCAPCIFDGSGTYLSIESTYDVYDKQDNLIRENCTASNKVKLTGVNPGVYKKLTLTVAPSYLYVLSEPDLDNPTVNIED